MRRWQIFIIKIKMLPTKMSHHFLDFIFHLHKNDIKCLLCNIVMRHSLITDILPRFIVQGKGSP